MFLCVYLQLLLEQRDFSNARFPGLIGLLHLSPLSSQSKPDILQFTLQLGLLIILEMGKNRWKVPVLSQNILYLILHWQATITWFSLPDKYVLSMFDYQGLQFKF